MLTIHHINDSIEAAKSKGDIPRHLVLPAAATDITPEAWPNRRLSVHWLRSRVDEVELPQDGVSASDGLLLDYDRLDVRELSLALNIYLSSLLSRKWYKSLTVCRSILAFGVLNGNTIAVS
jgi:hypothetical protein